MKLQYQTYQELIVSTIQKLLLLHHRGLVEHCKLVCEVNFVADQGPTLQLQLPAHYSAPMRFNSQALVLQVHHLLKLFMGWSRDRISSSPHSDIVLRRGYHFKELQLVPDE